MFDSSAQVRRHIGQLDQTGHVDGLLYVAATRCRKTLTVIVAS